MWKSSLFWLALVMVCGRLGAAPEPTLRQVQTIPLPGVERRIDHMAADPAGKRLFVAALGNDTVEVIDLAAGRRVHTITGLHEPQGVGYAPAARRLFVANGQSGTCAVFDADSYRPRGIVALGDDADNLRYDPAAGRVYVGYGAGAVAILDAASLRRVGSIRLPGHPESFQLEAHGPHLFVNVPSAGQIVVLDRIARTVIATWPVREARANFPMALDEAHHRLFVGCRDPATLLVYDTRSGAIVASFPIVGDTDDVFYDAARKRIYVSGGEGFLDVFTQADPDHYTRIGHLATAPGARTSFFFAQVSRLYVAVPRRGSRVAALFVYATGP